jgi:hypothetical protein
MLAQAKAILIRAGPHAAYGILQENAIKSQHNRMNPNLWPHRTSTIK